jgi:hypothetical protein
MRTFLVLRAIVVVLLGAAVVTLAIELLPYVIVGIVIGAIIRRPQGHTSAARRPAR